MKTQARVRLGLAVFFLSTLSGCPFVGDPIAYETVTLAITNAGTGQPLVGANVEVAHVLLHLHEGESLDEIIDAESEIGGVRTRVANDRGQVTVRFEILAQRPLTSPLLVRITSGEAREALPVDLTEGKTVTGEGISVTVLDITVTRPPSREFVHF